LHLRTGDTYGDEDQDGDENRANGQAAEPDGPRHLAGSFGPVHWQLTWVNCASFMNIYSSSAALQGTFRMEDKPYRDWQLAQLPLPKWPDRYTGGLPESAKITVIRLG